MKEKKTNYLLLGLGVVFALLFAGGVIRIMAGMMDLWTIIIVVIGLIGIIYVYISEDS